MLSMIDQRCTELIEYDLLLLPGGVLVAQKDRFDIFSLRS
jgi:hypothetical protein